MKRTGSLIASALIPLFLSISAISSSAETALITNSEKIYDLANGYVKDNLSGDVTVTIDEKGIVWISYRQLAIGESEFKDDDLQKFLHENNVDFTKIVIQHLDDSKEADVPVIAGDIDLNGSIDVTDLTELSLALIGDKEFITDQQKAADIDGDGLITLADLARLQQYLSKKINAL